MDAGALGERYRKLLDEMEQLAAKPKLTVKEDRRYLALDGQLRQLEEQMNAYLERKNAIMTATATEAGTDPGFNINRAGDPYDAGNLRADDSLTDLRHRLETGLERDGTPPDIAEAAARTLAGVHGTTVSNRAFMHQCLVTGSPAYRSAFGKYLAGAENTWTDVERQAVARAMSVGTDASGGYAVPFTLDSSIIFSDAGSINPIRQVARVVQTTTDSWNGVSAGAVSFSYDTEAEEVSDDSLTLAQPSVPTYRLSGFVPFSVELESDWPSFEQEIRRALMEGRDNAEATAHISGTGSGEPTGIVTALAGGASEVSATTSESFTAPDVYAVQRAVPARFRPNAVFLANIGTIGDVRQFDTGGGGNYITSLDSASPERLLGWRLYEASQMDDSPDIDAAATANNYVLLAGDFQNFAVVDHVGSMRVELVSHLVGANRRPTGQRGFFAWMRSGSDSLVDSSFAMLNVATSA